jgi:hypothetical protein
VITAHGDAGAAVAEPALRETEQAAGHQPNGWLAGTGANLTLALGRPAIPDIMLDTVGTNDGRASVQKGKVMAWKKKIGGCFGAADFLFGGHSSDRKRAREMIVEAGSANAKWSDVEQVARAYLQGKKCLPTHIDAEIVKMKDVANWLE